MRKLEDVLTMCDREETLELFLNIKEYFDVMLARLENEPNLKQEFEIMDKAYELIMQTTFIDCKH